MPATAPQISARHQANRLAVVKDMVTFLLRRYAEVGTYAEAVEAALDFACGMTDPQWAELGRRSGHYANGGAPDDDTTATVLRQLEALLPVQADDTDDTNDTDDDDPFDGLPGDDAMTTPAPQPTRWSSEHAGEYFSDCGRYYIERFVGTECGPWIVRYDPNGKCAGLGRMIVRHAQTMRECKDDVAAHIKHGDEGWWHHVPYGHVRTDGPERAERKRYRQAGVDYWRQQLPAEGIDLAEMADDEWVREDAVRIIRATYTTEAAAKQIVADIVEATR
jgi:hypothetical protein